jgi:hypothetical protein
VITGQAHSLHTLEPFLSFLSQELVQLWTDYFSLPWIVRGQSDEALAGTIGSLAQDMAGDLAHNFSISAKTLQVI